MQRDTPQGVLLDPGIHCPGEGFLLEVRDATEEDATGIAECLGVLGYGTPCALVAQRLVQFSQSNLDKVFVVHHANSGVVLGVASAHALPLFHTQGFCVRITAFAVRESAQGQGVGRQLVATLEQWAWSMGARKIEVTSGDHRPMAHRFYQTAGYMADERRFVKHAPSAEVHAG